MFELIKTAHWITHSLSAQSHPSHHLIHLIRPVPLPVHRHGRRGVFSLLAVLRSVSMRSSFPSIGLWRLIAFPSRRYCPLIGSPCQPSVFGSPVYRACLRLVVMPWAVRSSAHRLSPRSFDTGSVERLVSMLAWEGWCSRVRLMWYHRAPFSPWGYAACSLPRFFLPARSRPIPYRLAWSAAWKKRWGGRPSPSWRCGRHLASPGCLLNPTIVRISRAVPVCIRFSPRTIGLAPPLVSNKTWSKTGRDFTPVLDLPGW